MELTPYQIELILLGYENERLLNSVTTTFPYPGTPYWAELILLEWIGRSTIRYNEAGRLWRDLLWYRDTIVPFMMPEGAD
jgi:hypothetical protein